MEIAGSNIVVTGGASGIGRGLCERFAELGANHVVVADLVIDGATEVATAIEGTAVPCDVADEESVRSLVADAIDAMGHVDLFCANAGVGFGAGIDTPDAQWEITWQVNVMGPVNAARAVVPHMEARGGGSFMVTASAAGLVTGPTHFNYAASKHAAVGLAEWLAINHGPLIKVSCLCPTIVDTPMAELFGAELVQTLSVDQVVSSAVQGLLDETFLILPVPHPLELLRAKADDYDAFLADMQQRIAARNAARDE